MTIVKKEVPAGLLGDVRGSRQELLITRRGVAVARIVPMEPSDIRIQHGGRMKDTAEVLGEIFSSGETWNAES
jgi:antitoxin (DNA-binding transcriptional repressor) of toxin-antitoxin stability system